MLARFRYSALQRLLAPALLLGLALGVAAPARAAHVRAAERERAAALLAGADVARVEKAIRVAAARTTTAAGFAEEVARLLADGSGEPSPAADALLQALFGRLFRALFSWRSRGLVRFSPRFIAFRGRRKLCPALARFMLLRRG